MIDRVYVAKPLAVYDNSCLFDAVNDAAFLVAVDDAGAPLRFTAVNDIACSLLGLTRAELLARSPRDIVASGPNTITAQIRGVAAVVCEHGGHLFETVLVSKDGRQIPVEISVRRISIEGRAYNFSLARDISGRREVQQRVVEANRRLYDILESLPDATFVLDNERKVIAWNKAMERLTGVPKQDMLGRADYSAAIYGNAEKCLIDLVEVEPRALPWRYRDARRQGPALYAETYAQRLYGGMGADIAVMASVLRDENGRPIGAIESIRDITERRAMEERLEYLSSHDSLTGLANRAHFERALSQLTVTGQVNGIIVCDVDGLKLVNDSLGHPKGDALLRAAADTLATSVPDSVCVARIGGDEFAILLPGWEPAAVDAVCREIGDAVRLYSETHPDLPLSMSLGSSTAGGVTGAELFKQADDLMYREKIHRSTSARGAIVRALMKTLEARDIVAPRHAERMEALITSLARGCGLPQQKITELRLLARFHDIGKISISDDILRKPGALSPTEMADIRRHALAGSQIARATPDLLPIAEWILHHHERWDGAGYPAGMSGTAIPFECRLLAIVDAYDAMTNDRPYRRAMSHRVAVTELLRCAGSQFDPRLVELFLSLPERALTDDGPVC